MSDFGQYDLMIEDAIEDGIVAQQKRAIREFREDLEDSSFDDLPAGADELACERDNRPDPMNAISLATTAQTRFYETLRAERQFDLRSHPTPDPMTKEFARMAITWMKTLPFREERPATSNGIQTAIALPGEGFYSIQMEAWSSKDSTGIRVFKVIPNVTTGMLYGMELIGGKWIYVRSARKLIGAQIAAGKGHVLTLEEAKEYGKITGVCCRCGKVLTDPKSVEAGIGPICAGRF